MSDIEKLLEQVMAEHDDEAPRARDLLRALAAAEAPAETWSWRRRRGGLGTGRARRPGWLVPTVAATAVAVVMIGSAWAGGLLGGRNGARTDVGQAIRPAELSCPARYRGAAPWVPDRPVGVAGRSRLVPLRRPALAVVCGGLVAALNALPARTSTWGCSSKPPFHGQNDVLEFTYPQGPAVQVRVSSYCYPAIDNLSLQAYSAKTVLPVIERILGGS